MGWISDRHMRDGGSIGPGSAAKNANKGPLRKVVRTLRTSTSIFETSWVEMDCGHEGPSWGGSKARCRRCLKESETSLARETL